MSQLTVDQALALALSHHNAGRLQDAENIYRQILQVQPRHADALHLLGLLAHQVNRNDLAVQYVSQAVAANPGVANYYNTLGEIQRLSGRLVEALRAYDKAIALDRNAAAPVANRALVLQAQNRHDLAIASLTELVGRFPDACDAWNNLGTSYRALGRLTEAVGAYRQALRSNPEHVPALNNLAVSLHDLDECEEAVVHGTKATRLAPNLADTHHNLGLAQIKLNLVREAIASWQRATALRPDFADAQFNLALALLLMGDYAEGWRKHECRWLCRDLPKARPFSQAQWDGSPLGSRTLLVHAEQGFGDTIQFIRFWPELATKLGAGARVIFEMQPELLELLRRSPMFGGSTGVFVATGDVLPPFDTHIPLMSLPHILQTTLETVPRYVPYLVADGQKAVCWKDRLLGSPGGTSGQGGLRVGLVWAGRPAHANDRHRSIAAGELERLSRVAGVTFVSLQKGPAAAAPPFGMAAFTDQLETFDDTAALMANLDLVITVDTSLAHLAGALGKPVWTLLPFAPDWRWLLERADSPWYPSMRLFRQPGRFAWGPVIEQVAAELASVALVHRDSKIEP